MTEKIEVPSYEYLLKHGLEIGYNDIPNGFMQFSGETYYQLRGHVFIGNEYTKEVSVLESLKERKARLDYNERNNR